ncbi:S-adenosylmethionine:tRNA ribosyltransferase-isomerase [Capillimicrobium parvum]|uniref:S-adenosylmethionine:tRNA ribosyltransferase-isomerase n=1 Tax=Capillimicrobium parvum TaxID=2884022 RepID=A0A9E6XRW3_9ACTN|nr:S-adenosylmethionine:tRNA ribosyltransferase-isomerase [Capillimicrobium parvum]UGS33725.1 S-adenosylmethionine:tRNA ribosyltransferase-isomerase [Capillimicrobium parvum]
MTALAAPAFELPAGLEAHEPPEARGIARDGVRLMVATSGDGEVTHARFHDLPDLLAPGDLLVVNDSATVPAAIHAERADGTALEVRFSTPAPPALAPSAPAPSPPAPSALAPAGESRFGLAERGQSAPHAGDAWWIVELRTADGLRRMRGHAGERLALNGGARIELAAAYASSARLWLARIDADRPLGDHLARHGHPIRYAHVHGHWPLSAYQTAFARRPGSAEMPSAGRPFTPALLTRLLGAGVLVAPLTLHAGVSSLERGEAPYPERYAVPAATARAVEAVRGWGGRVVAVGTTVVRALESAADEDGAVHAAAGWTGLHVTPDRGVRAVDGLITGWHDPDASHLHMLEAIAGGPLLAESYAEARAAGYLWHEFGDSHLILR